MAAVYFDSWLTRSIDYTESILPMISSVLNNDKLVCGKYVFKMKIIAYKT